MWRMEVIGAKDVSLYQFQMIRSLLAACKEYEDKNEERINKSRENKPSHATMNDVSQFHKKHETEPNLEILPNKQIDLASW